MNRMIGAAGAVTLALTAGAEMRQVTLHRGGEIAAAWQNITATVDMTGDGVADIVTCAAGAPVVLTKQGSKLVTAWHGPWVGCHAFAVGDRNANGVADLITVGPGNNDGGGATLTVFEPATAVRAVGTITIPEAGGGGIAEIAIGNVDTDNQVEIVAVGAYDTFVYNGSSLALEWRASGHGGSQVRLGNIDDDALTEIVINGGTARILDASTRTLKWGYAGGFGSEMELASVDGDPESEIVYYRYGTVTILNGDDFNLSSFDAGDYVTDLVVADVNGDGAREIIIARNTWNGAIAYDTTGATVWTLQRSDITSLDAGDVDGDGTRELCFATSAFDFTLTVANLSAVEATITDVDGPFGTAIGDLDGDGNLEMVVGSRSTSDGYRPGLVQVLDYRTKAVEGTLVPNGGNGAWWPVIWQIEIGQLDADPALEVLVLGGDPSNGVLYAYDGATYEHQWISDADWGGVMAVTNMDQDAVDEIVITTNDGLVQVLHGASAVIQWASGTSLGWIGDLAVADVDSNGSKDILTVSGSTLTIHTPATNAARSMSVDYGLWQVAATTGRFSILHGNSSSGSVRTFRGSDLTEEWSCPFTVSGYDGSYLEYGPIAAQERLLFARGGTMQIYPLGGTACPTPESVVLGRATIRDISFAEVTGDDRPEVLVGVYGGYELVAIDSTAFPRGDVNRDTVVGDTDLDALTRYLLADGPGITPAADVDGNGHITTSDLFYLINYRRGTGPAPIP